MEKSGTEEGTGISRPPKLVYLPPSMARAVPATGDLHPLDRRSIVGTSTQVAKKHSVAPETPATLRK